MSATTDATNAVTEVVQKIKGFLYNAANATMGSQAVDTGVDMFANKTVCLYLATSTANASVNFYVDQDLHLKSAYFSSEDNVANSADNTVFIAVNANGVEVANVNTDAAGLGAITAGALEDLSVNTTNSKVEAGEYVVCYINHQTASNTCGGTFILNFDRV